MEEIEKKENTERYIRKDIEGGYIYNKSEISYYKQTQKLDVINNYMLGDYKPNGNYALDKDLIDQLVSLTKIYQYSFGANMFCQSLTDIGEYGKIDFAIKIVKDSPKKGYATAILSVLEPIDKANGYYTNTNSAQISSYSGMDSGSFIVDTLKKFNVISKKDSGLINKKKTEDIDLILARKKYEAMRKKLLSEKVEDIYKDIFNKKIKLLSKSAVGKKIIDEFSKESYKLNGWFVKEGMSGYYKTMDEVLQSLIEKYSVEVLQDVKLTAALNKLMGSEEKVINNAISMVDSVLANNATLSTELAKQQRNELADKKTEVVVQPRETAEENKKVNKEEAKIAANKEETKIAAKNEDKKESVVDKKVDVKQEKQQAEEQKNTEKTVEETQTNVTSGKESEAAEEVEVDSFIKEKDVDETDDSEFQSAHKNKVVKEKEVVNENIVVNKKDDELIM